MFKLILKKPVIHDGEELVPGDLIEVLTEKEKARLIRLDVAEEEKTPVPDVAKEVRETAAADPELVARLDSIKDMKKKDVLAELEKAGVEHDKKEKLADLQNKLAVAWTTPGIGTVDNTDSDASDGIRDDIAGMSRDELLAALLDENIDVDDKASDDKLRETLLEQWSGK